MSLHQLPVMYFFNLSGATAFPSDTASQPCFKTQKTTSFQMTGSIPFSWKSRPQRHQNLEQVPFYIYLVTFLFVFIIHIIQL